MVMPEIGYSEFHYFGDIPVKTTHNLSGKMIDFDFPEDKPFEESADEFRSQLLSNFSFDGSISTIKFLHNGAIRRGLLHNESNHIFTLAFNPDGTYEKIIGELSTQTVYTIAKDK